MISAVSAGGLLGSALSGPASRVRRQGLGMLVAGAAWTPSLAAFGWSGAFWLACLSLAFAGAADVTSVVLRTSLVQGLTPDNLRGRVSAVEFSVGAGAPALGNFRAGAVASLTSPTISAVSGGLSRSGRRRADRPGHPRTADLPVRARTAPWRRFRHCLGSHSSPHSAAGVTFTLTRPDHAFAITFSDRFHPPRPTHPTAGNTF